jgi:hypothetical protein
VHSDNARKAHKDGNGVCLLAPLDLSDAVLNDGHVVAMLRNAFVGSSMGAYRTCYHVFLAFLNDLLNRCVRGASIRSSSSVIRFTKGLKSYRAWVSSLWELTFLSNPRGVVPVGQEDSAPCCRKPLKCTSRIKVTTDAAYFHPHASK